MEVLAYKTAIDIFTLKRGDSNHGHTAARIAYMSATLLRRINFGPHDVEGQMFNS